MIKKKLKITTLVVIFPFMLFAQKEMKEIQLQVTKMNEALKSSDFLKAQEANVATGKQIAILTGNLLSKAFPRKVEDWSIDTVSTYSFVAEQGTDLVVSRDYYPKGAVPIEKKEDTIPKELSETESLPTGTPGMMKNPKKIILTITNSAMEAQGIAMLNSSAHNSVQESPGSAMQPEVQTAVKVKNQRATLKVMQSMHKIEISIICGAAVVKILGFNADLPLLNKFADTIDYTYVKSILGE